MSKTPTSQPGDGQPTPAQQQGQSAPSVQQAAGQAPKPKPQIRDWASL